VSEHENFRTNLSGECPGFGGREMPARRGRLRWFLMGRSLGDDGERPATEIGEIGGGTSVRGIQEIAIASVRDTDGPARNVMDRRVEMTRDLADGQLGAGVKLVRGEDRKVVELARWPRDGDGQAFQ
jgi:hypothetical protein